MPIDPTWPIISVDPRIAWGRPHIGGVSTEAIAGRVMGGDGVAETADDYDLTRHAVLLACWWEGAGGVYRRQWRPLAEQVGPALAGMVPLDVDCLPDPPSRRELAEVRQAQARR